ncbi:MAG: nuclear transport factor 2 family protein [Acidimicrobiaceae bacterium]|jgi:ketosteroid isomerase-like protein
MGDGSRLAELERRVQQLEDKDEIAQLGVRYGEAVDDKDADALRNLFTDDAQFHSANGLMDGRGIDGVMHHLAGRWGIIRTSFHNTHGHLIELDANDPDVATGVLFSHAEVVRDDVPMISALRYDDQYRRVDGRWRFAERMLSFFYYVEASDYVADLKTDTPVRVGAAPVAADLPRPDPKVADHG